MHTHKYFKFFFFCFVLFSCFSISRSYGFINSGDGFKWMVISISIVGGIFLQIRLKEIFHHSNQFRRIFTNPLPTVHIIFFLAEMIIALFRKPYLSLTGYDL